MNSLSLWVNKMLNTYNGWRIRGRQVKLGEKGLFRNEYGDFMFHKSQTKSIHEDESLELILVRRDRFGRFISSKRV